MVVTRALAGCGAGWVLGRMWWLWVWFFFQAEDGIRDLVRSRGLGDVYKRQEQVWRDDGQGSWRRGRWSLIDTRLLGVAGSAVFTLSLIHI